MKIDFKKKKKLQIPEKLNSLSEDEKSLLEVDSAILSESPVDRDGKVIFLYKNITPTWLIEELNNRFRRNKDRGTKGIVLPA